MHLHPRVLHRHHRDRGGVLLLQLAQPRGLRRLCRGLQRGAAGGFEQADQPLAAFLQRDLVALELDQPFLRGGELAAAELQAVGQSALVLLLELEDLRALLRQFRVQPVHVLLEELERLTRDAGPHPDVFLAGSG